MSLVLRAALVIALAAVPAAPAVAATVAPHHEAEVSYDPTTRDLAVVDRITVEGRRHLPLAVAPWLRVTAVRIDGAPRTAGARGEPLVLVGPGRHVVEVTATGRVPEFPTPEHDRGADGAMGGPAGLYLPGYVGWLPAADDTAMTFVLRIRTALPFRAVVTGDLIEDGDDGTTYRATVAAERPMEPPSLFAGPYRIAEARAGQVRLRTYFPADLAGLSADYLAQAARFLGRYSAEIGAYPYRDFHIVSAPLPVGLGFPSLTYVGRRVLPLPFMRGRSLAHEILHSWWGNGVTVDYARGNWAEGLTTYMADYALAADDGAAAARRMRLGWLRDFAALPADRDRPVTAFTSKVHQASQVIGYDKVAFIFHMLRREVGEDAFRDGLRRFWRDNRFRVAGWVDIERAFAAAAGRDLSWFFGQWLHRPGAPRIELAGARSSADPGGGYRVTVDLRQTGRVYRVAVPIVVETDAGPVRTTATFATADRRVVIPTPGRPRRVAADPGFDVFRALLPGESPPILRDVILASDSVTAILGRDPEVRRLAGVLAARMLDSDAIVLPPGDLPPDERPALIIGLAADIDAAAARLTVSPPRPLAGGDARAWTVRRGKAGAPTVVVSANDAAALAALVRPLPHYGRRSFVVFKGGRAVDKGLWPAGDTPLSRALTD